MPVRINLPPATRAVLISQLALSFLYNVARWRQLDDGPPASGTQSTPIVPYLTLVPSMFYYYPWTILTATFVEQNIFTVLMNGATVFYGGKYLERAWGSKEFGKFILVIALIPNALMIMIYIFWGAVTGSSVRGYASWFSDDECTTSCAMPTDDLVIRSLTQICGGVALQASFLVAFKQLVPEHTVTILKGIVKMRVKHFPAIFLLLNSVSGIVFGTDTAAILAWIGLLTSWTYLRFFKYQPDLTGTSTNGLGFKGDASETFTFATFFPDAIQPPIAFVTEQIYAFLVAVKVLTPFSAEDIASSTENAVARGQAGLPSLLSNSGSSARSAGKREEAERRRALALRALDQRLQAATASKPPALSSQTPAAPSSTAAPAVSAGQNMLGETTYTPDNS
uniref:Putative membrane protein n=1 Tax=Talaromyces marneffei PM1 TaxID=1077442 RepID=A0A093VJ89_TALMA